MARSSVDVYKRQSENLLIGGIHTIHPQVVEAVALLVGLEIKVVLTYSFVFKFVYEL